MEILDECTVEVVKHESKTIFCHIRVKPRNIKYQQCKEAISCPTQRWMHTEDWVEFHAGLEKLIKANEELSFEEGNEKHFHLNALIFVRVRKSRISIKSLSQCVNSSVVDRTKAIALECLIEYDERGKYTEKVTQNIRINTKYGGDYQEYDPLPEADKLSASSTYQPYTPGRKENAIVDSTEGNYFDEPYSPQPICENGLAENSSLPIIPYNASPIGKTLNNIVTLKVKNINDENEAVATHNMAQKTMLQNPDKLQEQKERSKNIQKEAIDELQTQNELKDCIVLASSQESISDIEIVDKSKIQEPKLLDQNENIDQVIEQGQNEECISLESSLEIQKNINVKDSQKRKKKSKHKHKHAAQTDKIKQKPARADVASEINYKSPDALDKKHDCLEKDNENTENIAISATPPTKSITTSPAILPQSDEDESSGSARKSRKRKDVNYCEDSITEPRRSSRSVRTPSRFIEQPTNFKLKKNTNSHRDLFGSDGDDDSRVDVDGIGAKVNRLATKTPEAKSAKKKRKRELTGDDYANEKCTMNKYLSKNRDVEEKPTDKKLRKKHEPSKSQKSSSVEPEIYAHPTKQELKERRNKEIIEIEENLRLRSELEKLAEPKPQKVQILSLNDMSTEDVLVTFTKHKLLLDEIFNKLKNKSTVRGYNGNNHYLVIYLIDKTHQLTMMDKLTEEYESAMDPTLFANAMMPEWIVAIFMDRFKFKRDEAIAHIKAQEEYRIYMDSDMQSD